MVKTRERVSELIAARIPLGLALVLVLALGAAGCGGGGSSAGPANTTIPPARSASTPASAGPTGQPGAGVPRAGREPVRLQIGYPTQGARVAGGLVFVAGAVEPPQRVTVNGRPAALEGIAFRLLVRYRRPGRQIIRIRATAPGFQPAQAWVAVCVTHGSRGGPPAAGGPGPGSRPGGPPFSPGALRGGVPTGPQLSLGRTRRVRCPRSG